MTDGIELDGAKRIHLSKLDYVTSGGQTYKVVADHFDGTYVLREVDGVSEEYKERWNDD